MKNQAIIAQKKDFPHALLCPIQKSGKTIGPPQNLRPIILLSVLRKLLAVCLMERIGERIDNEIPPTKRHIEQIVALQNMFLVRSWLLKELSHVGMKLST